MTIEQKKEYLSQVKILSRRIAFRTERICRMRREADAVKSRWGENISSHKQDAPYISLLEVIEAEEAQLHADNELMIQLQKEINEAVNKLPEEKMQLMILYRYFEGLTNLQIGELLCIERTTFFRLMHDAIENLVLPEKVIKIF